MKLSSFKLALFTPPLLSMLWYQTAAYGKNYHPYPQTQWWLCNGSCEPSERHRRAPPREMATASRREIQCGDCSRLTVKDSDTGEIKYQANSELTMGGAGGGIGDILEKNITKLITEYKDA